MIRSNVLDLVEHGRINPDGVPAVILQELPFKSLFARRYDDRVKFVRTQTAAFRFGYIADFGIEGCEFEDAVLPMLECLKLNDVSVHRELAQHIFELRRGSVDQHDGRNRLLKDDAVADSLLDIYLNAPGTKNMCRLLHNKLLELLLGGILVVLKRFT